MRDGLGSVARSLMIWSSEISNRSGKFSTLGTEGR